MFKKGRHHDADAADEIDSDEKGFEEGAREQPEADAEAAATEARTSEPASAVSLERERDEYRSNWQRAQADYQNLRRRLQADIEAGVQRSKQPMLESLLLVLDNLDMALRTPCSSAECRGVLQGVELTKAALISALERENVRPVRESGAFDAAVHQAVERVETDEHPAGALIEVRRRGYTFGNQVLRPAQVRVAVEPMARPGAVDEEGSSTESRENR